MIQLSTREELLTTVRELREAIERDVAEAGEERAIQSGSFEDLSLKDVVVHLTGWRLMTAERLEAGQRHESPTPPWPDTFDEEHDLDGINRWFDEQGKDTSLDQVMQESRDSFERVERAITQMSDDDLFQPNRFDWLDWTDEGLGPAVVRGSWSHYHEEHEADIRAWLNQSSS